MSPRRSISFSDPESPVRPYDRNPNRHTEYGRQVVEASISEVGTGRSIVLDKNGVIVAGDLTTEVAAALGMDVVIHDSDGKTLHAIRRTDWDLSDESPTNPARRYAYLDNRASEVSLEWDLEQVARDLAEGLSFDAIFPDTLLEDMMLDLEKSMGAEAPKRFKILVHCDDEDHQLELMERFLRDGIRFKRITQ